MSRQQAIFTLAGSFSMLAGSGACSLNHTGARMTTAAPALDDQAAPVGTDIARARIERKANKMNARVALHGTTANPQEAAEFHAAQRRPLDGGDIPIDQLFAIRAVIAQREQQLQAGERSAQGLDPQWIELGPGNIGGRTRVIVVDPQTPDTIYTAGVAGGIWKSMDAGASWFPLDDLMLNLAVTTIAINPVNTNILYAGTGEGVGGGASLPGFGIFKSVDAGATWFQLPFTVIPSLGDSFAWVNKLVISPNDPDVIYAGTRYGVWRSADAGNNWDLLLRNPLYITGPVEIPATNGSFNGCTDVVVRDDSDPDVLWAAFGNNQADGLFRSDDGGASWITYTVPATQGRMTLAIAPTNNDIMYICMAQNATANFGAILNVFRSTDGGDTWEGRLDFDTLIEPWLLGNLVFGGGCSDNFFGYHQGWHDNALAVDPVDPDVIWVGGIDLFRSDDGGLNWGIGCYWFYDEVNAMGAHADQHTIVFHPDYNGTTNQIMYVGSDGGVYRTTNARAATGQEDCPLEPDQTLPQITWEELNFSYGTTQFYHGDAASDIVAFAGGSQDNHVNIVLAEDTPNEWASIVGGDGGYFQFDHTNGQTMYTNVQFFPTIVKSTDGGETFFDAVDGITDEDGLFITPFAMDPNDPQVLWTGGSRPWRTINGATLWTLAGGDFANASRISAIAIAPTDSNRVYLGFENGYIARTTNGLAPSPTWTVFNSGLLIGGYVSSVAVDPQDANIVYCTYTNFGVPHVFRSANGGVSWTPIDGISFRNIPDIPAHWVIVRPNDSQQLFVGTELGVFVSNDTGANWDPFNDGLAHTIVETLDFRDDDTLVAFTHGRGAFLVDLDPNSTSCVASADCADTDGNGVRDDGCTFWECQTGACLGTGIVYADMGGPNGACPPDGTPDLNDRFHALNCFSNLNTTGGNGYNCEDAPPVAYNVDAAGLDAPCFPDGVCDANDAFAALNAFSLATTCSCSGPTPDGASSEPFIVDAARLSLQARQSAIRPGGTVEVDVVLDNALQDLRGYQLHVAATGGSRGTLKLVDITLEARKDAVYSEQSKWSAFNIDIAQMAAGLDTAGVPVRPKAYLATFVFEATHDARGTFAVELLHDDSDVDQRTVLFATSEAGRIQVIAAPFAEVTVHGVRDR